MAPEKGGDPRQWGGPAQSSSTRRAPRPTITKSSTSHTVLFRLKRFPRTKQVFKPLSYRLKRFRGTKFRFISDSGKETGKSDRQSNRESDRESDREKRQKQETETVRRVEWAEPALAPEKEGDPRQWGGPAQSSSTRRAPILTITKSSTSHTVLFHLKRFPRTKQVFKPLLYRLKRFHGTKSRFYYPTRKRDRGK